MRQSPAPAAAVEAVREQLVKKGVTLAEVARALELAERAESETTPESLEFSELSDL